MYTNGVKAKSPLLQVESLFNVLLLLTFVCCHAGLGSFASEGKLKLEGGRDWLYLIFLLISKDFVKRMKNLKTFPSWIELLLVAVPQVVKPVKIEKIYQLLLMMMMIMMTMMTMMMVANDDNYDDR